MQCYACNNKLEPVHDSGAQYQFDNALWISLNGGYGMFVDNIEETFVDKPDHQVVICHDCAHDLCEKVEWLDKLIDPTHSHTHKDQSLDHHNEPNSEYDEDLLL